MADTMLEKMARAMFERTDDEPWERAEKATVDIYLGDARAVLEAMREPSEGTVEAGEVDLCVPCTSTTEHSYLMSSQDAREAWQAMIDAILEEHDKASPAAAHGDSEGTG